MDYIEISGCKIYMIDFEKIIIVIDIDKFAASLTLNFILS